VTDVPCPLCVASHAESILWQDERCRVVDVGDRDYPGYCRVIWNQHIREMTDLAIEPRTHLLAIVCSVEQVLRELLRPDKINLASLGNQVPHLHWHIVPRFADDPHFPDSIWATRQRAGAPRTVDRAAIARELVRQLAH